MKRSKLAYNLYCKIDKQWKPFVVEEIANYIYVNYFLEDCPPKMKRRYRLKINPDKAIYKNETGS